MKNWWLSNLIHAPWSFVTWSFVICWALSTAVPAGAVDKACVFCHEETEAGTPGRLLNLPPALCIACHPDRIAPVEHQSGMRPNRAMKRELPLDNGLVSCTTCHDPHGRERGMLRLPADALCASCHEK